MTTRILFIGDVVGEPGLALLEAHLPGLAARHRADFVIVNAENMDMTQGGVGFGNCGMTRASLARLFALPVDLVTGGNHSWDGAESAEALADERVLRPLNYGQQAPGRGAAIIEKQGVRLGVINLVSRTALPQADTPLAAFEQQLSGWAADLVLVDFHGESVTEKQTFGFAAAGRVAAVLGTHTHVATLDTRLLPGGTAYVTDVGMTGPNGGIQGYAPEMFVESARTRLRTLRYPFALAGGAVELGAVLVTCEGRQAVEIVRVTL